MKALAVVMLVTLSAYADKPKALRNAEVTRIDGMTPEGDDDSFIRAANVAVTASSTLADKKDAYAAKNVVDGKLETAWCEGDKGNGEGASLTFALDKATDIGGFWISPHYAKNFDRMSKNNRVAELEIATDEGSATVELDDLAKYVREHNDVKETGGDENGASRDERAGMIGYNVSFAAVKTKTVKLTIRAVHKGSISDTCISEIHLYK